MHEKKYLGPYTLGDINLFMRAQNPDIGFVLS